MERDYVDEFFLSAESGYIHLKINEVFGYPETTCFSGGYNTRSSIEIVSSNFKVNDIVYISTGELYEFYSQLNECYRTNEGTAKLNSSENDLNIDVVFDGLGYADICGFLQDGNENELKFQLSTNQANILQIISELSDIYKKYGDMQGLRKGTSDNSNKGE